MFEARKQIERLQTVDAERLEKVVIGRKLFAARLRISSSV
jgi:hypothetical protein